MLAQHRPEIAASSLGDGEDTLDIGRERWNHAAVVMLTRTLRASALAVVLTLSCSSASDRPSSPSERPPGAEDVLAGSVAHRDPRRGGAPSFVWLNRAGAPSSSSASAAAAAMLPTVERAFRVAAAETVRLASVDGPGDGPIVARYEQRVAGLEVFRGGASVMMTRALRPVAAAGLLAQTTRGSERAFVLAPEDALARGARLMGVNASFSRTSDDGGYERFTAPGLHAPARVKKVLYPLEARERGDGGELEPAYQVELIADAGPARVFVLSASDGRVLFEIDLVRHDAFTYRVFADPETKRPMVGPQGDLYAPHPTGVPDKQRLEWQASQLVTLESYPFSRSDPWLAPDATTTSGNNVYAFADLAAPDGYSAGSDVLPALTSASTFDHVYDTSASPNATPAAIQAATTHLFYVTNFLHDWFYDAGFDEASHNPQLDNFGRGGLGRDPLHAEAQDHSGRNNANAMVPPDGTSPRIQMFIFSGASDASLSVVSPASIAGTKSVGIASGFGADAFDVTGAVVLAVDGGGPDVADACEPLEVDVSGKIVLAHRGTCSFAQKAVNAEAAGALGVIIANVASSTNAQAAPFMGGQESGLTIPVLSLSFADGAALEGALGAGVTVTMKRELGRDLDGALDTTIVAHEWGHVLSSRLVGNGLGLRTNQAGGLGEGWGDFVALLLMTRADDPGRWGGTYAIGSYATSGSGDDIYYGTRRLPYSIDPTKNGLSLRHVANGSPLPADVATSFGEDGSFNAAVHNTGEVWATMLWECYASLLREGRLSFAEAQDRMKRYLVASLKLTPPDPTILEARDALLAAVLAVDEQDFQLFWRAFARRGAGAGAVAPPKDSATNQGVIESFEADNHLQIVEAKLDDDVISCERDGILDEGEVGSIELTVRNTGSGALSETKAEVVSLTDGVTVLDQAPVALAPLAPFESTTLKLDVAVTGTKQNEPVTLDVVLTDPLLPAGSVVHAEVLTRYEADLAPDASAIDRVNTTKTAWKVSGSGAGEKWSRSTTTGDGHWTIGDPPQRADHRLTSPKFTIDDVTFSLALKHRWSFKRSVRRNVDIDGGVIEVSVDGETWEDLSRYGKVDYTTTLDDSARSDNPLKGREAYGGESAGFPDAWITSRIDLVFAERPESVQLRFRVGATFGRATDGWAIDDIELIGTSSTPFWAYVPHADACMITGPTTDAGAPQVVTSGATVTLAGTATHPTELPLTYAWSQVAGPAVTLSDAATLAPTFQAPEVDVPTTVTLALRAHDGTYVSPASRVDVVVEPALTPSVSGAGCACRATPAKRPAAGALGLLGVAALLARRERRRAGELNRLRGGGGQ